jgi:hypothetical protein
MTQQTTMPTTNRGGPAGEDWTCSLCGAEIMVKHPGDPNRMDSDSAYTCRCGTRMERKHGRATPTPRPATAG